MPRRVLLHLCGNLISRGIVTSSPALARAPSSFMFRTVSNSVKEIGHLLPFTDAPYGVGQLFVHRVFAYKGIVLCSFNCKVHTREPQSNDFSVTNELQYQVLIHRGDWAYMGFPVDMTYYLADRERAGRGEKLLTNMSGLDCVSHKDVVPFAGSERAPIDHDLFDRIFAPAPITDESPASKSAVRYVLQPSLQQYYLSSTKSWMAPRDVYRETTEGVEVTVTTFYLGMNIINGQQRFTWRYVIRIVNKTENCLVLRERQLKIFSFNNLHQLSGHGVVGRQPELTPSKPAFQFSSTVDLPQSKGGHMWGTFKMERENGTILVVNIPMSTMDTSTSNTPEVPPPPTELGPPPAGGEKTSE